MTETEAGKNPLATALGTYYPRHYVVAVLWESTRRRAREAGERIAQAAERVPIDALSELVERELTAVQERAEWAVRVGQL